MNRKRARIVISGLVLLILCAACNASLGSPQAQVNCVGAGQEYVCSVVHTSGGSGQICWEIRATCANGTVASANSCIQIEPGATVEHRVPTSSFSNWQACDSVATLQVVDTTAR